LKQDKLGFFILEKLSGYGRMIEVKGVKEGLFENEIFKKDHSYCEEQNNDRFEMQKC